MSTMLHEVYRPKCWDEVLGQSKAVSTLRRLADRGLAGRAVILTGPTGSGKTTMARLLAAEWSADWATIELDATGMTVSEVDELSRRCSTRPLEGKGWTIIVNEAHGLTPSVCRKLLTALEGRFPLALFIFTTTGDGLETVYEKLPDARPFIGRMNHVPMAQRGIADVIAEKAKQVAMAEGLDGKPLEAYKRLANDCRQSWREVYSRIESGVMASED